MVRAVVVEARLLALVPCGDAREAEVARVQLGDVGPSGAQTGAAWKEIVIQSNKADGSLSAETKERVL